MTAIIFDMDGLLIDSEPLWQQAEIASFAEVGITLTREMCRQTMGLRSDEMVKYWFDRCPWAGRSLKEIELLILGRLERLIRDESKPMIGAIELVRRFEKAGLDMAIASSSPLQVIEAVADRFGIANSICVMRSAESQVYGKPHPGVFLDTASDLGRAPGSCVVFEDSITGVIAGKAAKMITIAVPDKAMFDRPEFSIADLKMTTLLDFDERCFDRFVRSQATGTTDGLAEGNQNA
jgi:mannitol-1-/sugar-/sorbitol-6-/2-deoxyglucose-6-phosphatase